MDCSHTAFPNDDDYRAEFRRRAAKERIPLSGSINLVTRCNVKCVHCYIRDLPGQKTTGESLSTDRLIGIIDEAVAAGCLFLLITGGEPLLHPDFAMIYEHTRRQGVLMSVFTNGTLLTKEHIALFKKLPPYQLEITLYGGTQETFDQVAGVPGAYEACHKGIQLLVDGGIPFRLKTMLLTLNLHQLDMMRAFAESVKAKFRFDGMINPRMDGDLSPLQYRISAEDAVAAEMSDPDRARRRREYALQDPKPGRQKYLYRCGTGTTSFSISGEGRLQPCLLVTDPSEDLKNQSFAEAWGKLADIRQIETEPDRPCRTCGDLPYCGYCPPAMQLENGMHVGEENYICQLGRLRRLAALEHMES